MTEVNLAIQAGEPFSRIIEVTLPAGRAYWTLLGDFEVRAEVRTGPRESDDLLTDLTPNLDVSLAGDVVTITLDLTGADTRPMVAGYWDLLISDVGTTDARAVRLVGGRVKVRTIVTAAS